MAPHPMQMPGMQQQMWVDPGGKGKVGKGIVNYGQADHLTRLIRAAAPMPFVDPTAAMEPKPPLDPVNENDWFCKCGEINFKKRKVCAKCGAEKTTEDAVGEMSWADVCKMARKKGGKSRSRSRSRSKKKRKKKKKKRRKSSSSSSSSSSDSDSRSREKRKDSAGERVKGASSTAAPLDLSDTDNPAPAKEVAKPEIEKAKHETLQRVLKLRDADVTPEERRRQWRALLREWHPDKHEDKEMATAVFQFLQKSRSLLNIDGSS